MEGERGCSGFGDVQRGRECGLAEHPLPEEAPRYTDPYTVPYNPMCNSRPAVPDGVRVREIVIPPGQVYETLTLTLTLNPKP